MKPDGVAWLFAPSGVKDGPLPTHYEPLESPVGNLLYPRQTCTPGCAHLPGTSQPSGPHARDRVPRGGHHLPTHRALPERADEPVQLLAQRIAAGDVRRAEPGAGRRARHRPRRLGDGQLGARPHRGARDGDPEDASARRRRASDPPGRPPIPLGVRRTDRRRQRQRPDLPGRRAEREHARGKVLRLPGRARSTQRTHFAADRVIRDLADPQAHSRHAGLGPAGREYSPMGIRELELAELPQASDPPIGPLSAIVNRLTWPFRCGHVRAPAVHRFLHRYHGLHRLQVVRSRLQAVESARRGRARTGPATATTTRPSSPPRPGGM